MFSVLKWRCAEVSAKGFREMALIGKARFERDGDHRLARIFQQRSRPLQPAAARVFSWRAGEEPAECPGEMNRVNLGRVSYVGN